MKLPKGECPCGSGKPSGECCYQDTPPISRPAEIQVNGLKLEPTIQVIDSRGVPVTRKHRLKVRGTFRVSDLLVTEDFILRIVKRAQQDIAHRLPPLAFVSDDNKLQEILYERLLVNSLYRNLKAVHYHLQGFITRYLFVLKDFRTRKVQIGNSLVKLIDEDFPLEFEFEAFQVRYRTGVELAFKLMAIKAAECDPRTDEKWMGKTIKNINSSKDNIGKSLARILEENNSWLMEQRGIRNSITHDSKNEVFEHFGHERSRDLSAKVRNRTADKECFTMFRQLLNFTSAVVDSVYNKSG